MTSGESSNEDVDAPVIGLIVLEVCVHDFETFVVADSDLSYVEQWVGDVSEEISCDVIFQIVFWAFLLGHSSRRVEW